MSADDGDPSSSSASPLGGCKSLKSAEPDLEVVVGRGDSMRTYHHHSVLLASYSDYIDAMLATPMREKETRRITFPDVAPADWEKVLLMHQLDGRRDLRSFLNRDEAPVLLPLLDKYQFNHVLGACDALLADLFGRWRRSELTAGDLSNAIALAQAAHGLRATRMELARPQMAAFAAEKLDVMPTSLSTADVEVLLTLIDEGNAALERFAEIANGEVGVHSPNTSPPELLARIIRRLGLETRRERTEFSNKIKEITKNPGFADRLRMRTLQLSEQDDMMKRLVVKRLRVDASTELDADLNIVVGDYARKDTGVEGLVAKWGKIAGAKKHCYTKHYTSEDGDAKRIVVEACDLFGTAWVMSDCFIDAQDGHGFSGRFLFFWESEFGSLLPPKYGWRKAQTVGLGGKFPNSIFDDDNPTLHYNIESRTW